jgi:hypothetical protein
VSQASLVRSLKPAFVPRHEAFGAVVGDAPLRHRRAQRLFITTDDAIWAAELAAKGA